MVHSGHPFFFAFFINYLLRGKNPLFFRTYPLQEAILQKGGADMKLRHRVRVNVCRPGGNKEAVLETAQTKVRSRFLSRLVGDRYAVLVLTPVGMSVDAVEIHEIKKDY